MRLISMTVRRVTYRGAKPYNTGAGHPPYDSSLAIQRGDIADAHAATSIAGDLDVFWVTESHPADVLLTNRLKQSALEKRLRDDKSAWLEQFDLILRINSVVDMSDMESNPFVVADWTQRLNGQLPRI